MPTTQATTSTTAATEQQQEDKKCHDETLAKELSNINAQLEDAKRMCVMSCRVVLRQQLISTFICVLVFHTATLVFSTAHFSMS